MSKDGRFTPGDKRINRGGRPKGSDYTSQLKKRLNGREDKLIEVILKQALGGCTDSQKLVADRLWPKTKPQSQPIPFTYHPQMSVDDLTKSVLRSLANGGPPDTGMQLLQTLNAIKELVRQELDPEDTGYHLTVGIKKLLDDMDKSVPDCTDDDDEK